MENGIRIVGCLVSRVSDKTLHIFSRRACQTSTTLSSLSTLPVLVSMKWPVEFRIPQASCRVQRNLEWALWVSSNIRPCVLYTDYYTCPPLELYKVNVAILNTGQSNTKLKGNFQGSKGNHDWFISLVFYKPIKNTWLMEGCQYYGTRKSGRAWEKALTVTLALFVKWYLTVCHFCRWRARGYGGKPEGPSAHVIWMRRAEYGELCPHRVCVFIPAIRGSADRRKEEKSHWLYLSRYSRFEERIEE